MTARKRKGTESTAPPSRPSRDPKDAWAIVVLLVICFAVFANGLHGSFVYDDTKQIVKNELIQQDRYFGKALTSDVWGFKGEKGEAWSNYWRPVFILWLVANERLFGIDNPVGWHVACVLLHAFVCGLAYAMLRRLDLSRAVAFAIALIFAVHPVHVESVTWISGSGDGVLASAILGCLLCILDGRRAAALACFGLALFSKEITVFFGLIVFVTLYVTQPETRARDARLRAAVSGSIPYLALTLVYVALHFIVIGRAQIATPWQTGPAGVALTAPSLLFFYLRQALLPLWLAPAHAIRAVTPETIGAANFLLPLAGVSAAFVFLFRIARGAPVRQVGLALFLVPLVPTLNINAFVPEQLVQDRYLYLPILGLLMVLVPALDTWLTRKGLANEHGELTLKAAVPVSVALAIGTIAYNPVWGGERALWTAAIAADPNSAFSLTEYARIMKDDGRDAEAKAALDRALAIRPLMMAYLQRAELAMKEGDHPQDASRKADRFAAAEADLSDVLSAQPDNFLAYERLAVCYQRTGQLQKAEDVLRTAAERVPHMKAALTDMLAVILYSQGRKDEALAELEGARELALHEFGGTASMVFFHLGSLYAEMGRSADARAALEQFLRSSVNLRDPTTLAARTKTQSLLSGMR